MGTAARKGGGGGGAGARGFARNVTLPALITLGRSRVVPKTPATTAGTDELEAPLAEAVGPSAMARRICCPVNCFPERRSEVATVPFFTLRRVCLLGRFRLICDAAEDFGAML